MLTHQVLGNIIQMGKYIRGPQLQLHEVVENAKSRLIASVKQRLMFPGCAPPASNSPHTSQDSTQHKAISTFMVAVTNASVTGSPPYATPTPQVQIP